MNYYEGYDISAECIAEAQSRVDTMAKDPSCSVHLKVADCFTDEFLTSLQRRAEQFHVVSIQFALHYACASEEKVRQVVQAVSACLVPGGVVVITTVDPFELSRRVRRKHFGNAMYSIELLNSEPTWVSCDDGGDTSEPVLTPGTGYHFKLRGFVDCVEYVVPANYVRACMEEAKMEECPEVSKPFALFLRDYEKDWSKNRGNTLTSAEKDLTTLYMSLVFRKRFSGEEGC